MPDQHDTPPLLSCYWDHRTASWHHFIGDRPVSADEFDAARSTAPRWGVKSTPAKQGIWWLTRDGLEVGSVQIIVGLATPATTIGRILQALERDGEQ